MALNKATLAAGLKAVFDGVTPEASGNTDPAALRQKVANEMANVIDAYIKSAIVTVAAGITVTTTGTATAHSGATTAQGTGTIS